LVALAPLGVVTVTFTVPVPAGLTAVIEVAELTVKLVAAVVPNCTAVAPVKPVPVTVTLLPPAVGPLVGLMPVTVGAALYVNWSAELVALVPPEVVTVTFTVPVPAGLTAVIEVADLTVKLVAAVVPNCTAVAPMKPVPVTVTLLPPAVGPLVGLMPITVGAALLHRAADNALAFGVPSPEAMS
jgi:hypothetical protein